MSRVVKRNTVTAISNENKLVKGKKHVSNIKVVPATKRKSTEEAPNLKTSKIKRAAFGDITNAAAKGAQDSGKPGIKKQVKRGLNNFVEKGKTSLRSSLRRKNAKSAEEVSESPSKKITLSRSSSNSSKSISSSSSEEALMCVIDSSESSSSVEVDKEVIEVFECPEPPRTIPPEGVDDFDGETPGDPEQHSDYAMETFQYYKDREAMFRVGDYLSQQCWITPLMRSILVDWLIEVQESFELNHETLYTAVKATDIYISKKEVRKEDLQLVGATACLIACKIDERIPPLVDDFLYVCDDAYSRDELMSMETRMLAVIGFDLGYSLSYRFIRRYGRVCRIKMDTLTLGRYILETSLMEYILNVNTSESKLAAAALVLAMKMKGLTGYKATLEYFSGYKMEELQPIVNNLLEMLNRPVNEKLKTVRSKYSHKVFHEVAKIPVPEAVDVSSD